MALARNLSTMGSFTGPAMGGSNVKSVGSWRTSGTKKPMKASSSAYAKNARGAIYRTGAPKKFAPAKSFAPAMGGMGGAGMYLSKGLHTGRTIAPTSYKKIPLKKKG